MREILASRNDNDSRLDTGFAALTPEERAAFRAEYRALAPERRNEKGTIVLLLGKEASSPEDWAFLREAAGEPPCLGLADCSKAGPSSGPGDEVTLAYPALVALKQAQRVLEKGESSQARSVLEAGKGSKAKAVVRLASLIEKKLPRR